MYVRVKLEVNSIQGQVFDMIIPTSQLAECSASCIAYYERNAKDYTNYSHLLLYYTKM